MEHKIQRLIRAVLPAGGCILGRFGHTGIVQLQGTHHPVFVIRMYLCRSRRIHLLQCTVQLCAVLCQQLPAQVRVRLHMGKLNVVNKAVNKQPGAANQNRHLTPGGNIRHRLRCQFAILSHAKRRVRGQNLCQMVHRCLPLRCRRRRSGNGHTGIDLHRVGTHNLAVQPPSQGNAQTGFAGGGGTGHHKYLCLHTHALPNCLSISYRLTLIITGRPWGQ